jgi:hypothetical protein
MSHWRPAGVCSLDHQSCCPRRELRGPPDCQGTWGQKSVCAPQTVLPPSYLEHLLQSASLVHTPHSHTSHAKSVCVPFAVRHSHSETEGTSFSQSTNNTCTRTPQFVLSHHCQLSLPDNSQPLGVCKRSLLVTQDPSPQSQSSRCHAPPSATVPLVVVVPWTLGSQRSLVTRSTMHRQFTTSVTREAT